MRVRKTHPPIAADLLPPVPLFVFLHYTPRTTQLIVQNNILDCYIYKTEVADKDLDLESDL